MTRRPWLLLGIAVLLLGQSVAGAAVARQEEHRFSVDFTDAPLGDALRILFHDTPYAFSLGPGLEGLPVTLSLNNVTFRQALSAVLALHGLASARSGDVYQIVLRGQEPSYAWALAPGPIVIYSRVLPEEGKTEILWRAFTSHRRARASSEEHVLYTVEGPGRMLPLELGCMPSPDGSGLLVWQMKSRGHQEWATKWLAVRLLDGVLTELGETPGVPWLSDLSPLPYWDYWENHSRLVVVPGTCIYTPDLGSLRGALPDPEAPISETSARGGHGSAGERLSAYCEQHHRAEAEHLRLAFAKLANEMEVGYLGFYDPAATPHLLLMSLGIPAGRHPGRDGGWSVPSREAACSPDGRLIAHADRWRHEGLSTPEKREVPTYYGLGARLDVFDVATGRRVWYARRASVPRWVSQRYQSVRSSMEWTAPRFSDVRWSRDGRYLSFTTSEEIYQGSGLWCSVTVLDVVEWRPVLHLPNASNAFVVVPPAAETTEGP